ncbi:MULTISPECIES: major capsid protein [Pseudomonas]|uniref:major capsid protein n=1 Tax=Pseudomonas TaxID=286 RepID=UPI002118E4CA|nr:MULTISPECIES: major capsid protein [Pseudomonas]
MADRLKQLRVVDPVLTNLARGYRNAQFIGEALFPIALMDKEAGTVPLFGKEAFDVYETERAIRAQSNIMNPDDVDGLDVVLREHDIAYPVDYRESNESMFDAESRASRRVVDVIDLRREIACARLAQNPGSYQAGAKVTLAGSSQWSNGGGDPVADVERGKEVVRSRIGVRPNTITMGASVYASLKFHPKLQEALGGNERKLITLEHLKALFGINDIYIGEALANTGTFGDIWSDSLQLAYVAKPQSGAKASYEDPSFGYTLRRKGMPEIDAYDTAGGKVRYVRNTDIYKPVVVGSDAGYLISDINA